MKKAQNFFPIGASYAPLPKATEVDISEWSDDLKRFKALGLNTFRLFICWDRVEKRRGVRDFSRIDYAFKLAEENDLKVIVNMGGTFDNLQAIYPPRWLWYDLHCTVRKPRPDSPETVEANRFKLCYDDPVYQREAKNFLQEAVARYKDNPQLIAWSGWNEPRVAECYCKHTLRFFRDYLNEKYGSLDALAEAWSTEFPVYFRTWEDVFPQSEASFHGGGYIPFLDWREFQEYNRTEKFNLIRSWIKEIDPDTPVISHLHRTAAADIFGKSDILGTSIYTIHAQRKGNDWDPYEYTVRNNLPFLSEGRRSHREDPNGFWVVETEAGPVWWVHNLIPRSYSPRKMNARDVLFVANGARALLRWLYRSRVSDTQAGEFNMVGWDGSMTERAREFGKLADFLNANSEVLLSHEPANPGIFIWSDSDFVNHTEAEGYTVRYGGSKFGYYHALRHAGYTAEFCNTRQLKEGLLKSAKALFIPFHPYVDPDIAEILREFVANGGLLVVEAPFAIKNMNAIHYEITPGKLTDVFGVQVFDMVKLESGICGDLPAFDLRPVMRPQGGTVEKVFPDDGTPAIVSNTYGKGKTVYYASVLGSAYDPDAGEAFRQELVSRLSAVGLKPGWKIGGGCDASNKNIYVCPRALADGSTLLFILNMDDRASEFTVALPGVSQCRELGCSEEHGNTFADGKFTLKLGDWGWSIWVCR